MIQRVMEQKLIQEDLTNFLNVRNEIDFADAYLQMEVEGTGDNQHSQRPVTVPETTLRSQMRTCYFPRSHGSDDRRT